MKNKSTLLIILLSTLLPIASFSQNYLYSNLNTGKFDILSYLPGTSEPDSAWYTKDFDDSSWERNIAVIGYGYGPDGYIKIDSTAKSLYVRFPFTIENKNLIKQLNFCFDYDDGYIAYLNGVEIARVNADKATKFPAFDAVATRSHASEFIMGLTSPVLGIYLDSTILANCLADGENIVAVHIINDEEGTDLMFIPSLMDISDRRIGFSDIYYSRFDSRYKRLVDVDSTILPLFVIETDQNGIAYDQRIWTTAHMGIINNGEGKFNKPSNPYNEYDGLISIRARGQSSRDFPKKSYRIELVNEDITDTSFALLGMPKESDWILFGPYTDKSQVRNKLAYDLASRMGHYNPRTRFCELVLNGQSEGIYLLTEQIKRDNDRVDISKLKETDISGDDLTGGYLYKYDKGDVFPKGAIRINQREIVYPELPTEEQQYYLKRFFTVFDSILTKTNDFSDPVKGFRKYASDSSLVDFIIINELAKNPDAYIYSTYMYKDRDDKDGRMKFGPLWDCDIAFGNSQFQQGSKTSGWQFDINANNSGMRLTRYFQDTTFVNLFQNRWHELRANKLSNDSIFSYFDQFVDQVKLVQNRNYTIWPIIDKNLFFQPYYVKSYENEIDYLKDWITTRLEWIDNNIDYLYYELNIVVNNSFETVAGVNLRVFPNPFDNELTIDFNLDQEGEVRLDLYNLTGQLQHRVDIGKVSGYQQITLNDHTLTSLRQGMYVAKLLVNNTPAQSVKVIKH